jgi:hypothetical protein
VTPCLARGLEPRSSSALVVEGITAGLERKAARGGWCGGQHPGAGLPHKERALWSKKSFLTVLRNRVYIGEIYYRGNWYPAPHVDARSQIERPSAYLRFALSRVPWS